MNNLNNVLTGMDWELFRKQKNALIAVIESARDLDMGDATIDHLDGLLDGIDALQDAIVADGLIAESVVFPSLESEA